MFEIQPNNFKAADQTGKIANAVFTQTNQS